MLVYSTDFNAFSVGLYNRGQISIRIPVESAACAAAERSTDPHPTPAHSTSCGQTLIIYSRCCWYGPTTPTRCPRPPAAVSVTFVRNLQLWRTQLSIVCQQLSQDGHRYSLALGQNFIGPLGTRRFVRLLVGRGGGIFPTSNNQWYRRS